VTATSEATSEEDEDRHPRRVRVISVASVLLLLFVAAGAYQLGRPKHVKLRRGGAFAATRIHDRVDAIGPAASSGSAPSIDTSGVPDFSAAARATPTTAKTASTSTTLPSAAVAAATPSGPLALGTYTYALKGSESATGFGSRQYPSEMTITAHAAPGVAKDQAVLDLFFSSQHQERDIVAYRGDSIAFTFEGGSITFGPSTQTSEASYAPAMTQIPLPLSAGDKRSGTTEAKAKNGSVSRVDDWTVRVVGQETLVIGGRSIPTWVVTTERKTRPGSANQETGSRTYWYDPARRIWVKWKEKMHGERKAVGFSVTYDTTSEAVRTRFTAA
jgi:hypothetical protein